MLSSCLLKELAGSRGYRQTQNRCSLFYTCMQKDLFLCACGKGGVKSQTSWGKKVIQDMRGKKKTTKKSQDKAADLTPLAERS